MTIIISLSDGTGGVAGSSGHGGGGGGGGIGHQAVGGGSDGPTPVVSGDGLPT